MNSRKRGRPKGSKNRNVEPKGKIIKIRDLAGNPLTHYLNEVKIAQQIATISGAGELVIGEAAAQRRFLTPGIDTTIVTEPTP